LIYYLVVEDSCSMLPSALKQHGSAFACGVARISALSMIFVLAGVQAYFIFTVWSLAEDLKLCGSKRGLPELLPSKGKKEESFFISEGIFGVGTSLNGPYPVNYGSLATPGIGGGSNIFGSYHDVDYPPKAI